MMACSTGIPYKGWGPRFSPRCVKDWGERVSQLREAGPSLYWALRLPVSSVGPTSHREMKSVAWRRESESRSSSSHEVF